VKPLEGIVRMGPVALATHRTDRAVPAAAASFLLGNIKMNTAERSKHIQG
jgi:hypothetical protein